MVAGFLKAQSIAATVADTCAIRLRQAVPGWSGSVSAAEPERWKPDAVNSFRRIRQAVSDTPDITATAVSGIPSIVIWVVPYPESAPDMSAIAAVLKAAFPATRMIALDKTGALDKGLPGIDRVVPWEGPGGMAGLAAGLSTGPVGTFWPDFSGFHTPDYLISPRILPVDPFFFQDPGQLSDFLNRLQADGFAFQDGHGASPRDVLTQLAPWLQQKDAAQFFSLRTDLPGALDDTQIDAVSQMAKAGLHLIHWQASPESGQLPKKELWQMSKSEVWHHLSFGKRTWGGATAAADAVSRFILDNPNIVHSHDGPCRGGAYDGVAPLPGIPLWQTIGDPQLLSACLAHQPQRRLIRMRWDEKAGRVITLGSDISFHFKAPADLPYGFLDDICRMVDAGGSVDITHVRANLEKAYLIGYAMENGVIVGNSSLKHPREAFIRRLRLGTGLDFSGCVERGYTSVRPEYRSLGVGRRLLEGLTARAGAYKVFSIIDEKNLATQKIAIRNNTRKILTYYSENLSKDMGIWMPEGMDPEMPDQ